MKRIAPKRPKHERACEFCRRRKIRCDASEKPPGSPCSKCTTYGVECLYNSNIHSRPHLRSYVDALEERMRLMESLLQKLQPEIPESTNPRVSVASNGLSHDIPDLASSDDESDSGSWTVNGDTLRYEGKSSNAQLIRTVMDLKAERTNPIQSRSLTSGSSSEQEPVDLVESSYAPPYAEFPTENVLDVLVEAYFENFNIYLPLLHKPTFQQGIKEALHMRDRGFGLVVLLVCANGSRWRPSEGRSDAEPGTPPGWRWFAQAGSAPWSALSRPTLYDLQSCALMAAYVHSLNPPQGSWAVLGLGIWMALDIGAHRRRTYTAKSPVKDELWRRAFWVLVALDRLTSFGMGRPCAIQDEDFDLDPMTECDDEYWAGPDSSPAFQQPEGRPSEIAFANCFVRLLGILASASRTIYTINKSKLLLGFVGSEWKQRVVAELDSALNNWFDTIPPHLRWDPNIEDPTFLAQSAALHANFYHAQICVHREFLLSPRRPAFPSPQSPSHTAHLPSHPSLTICKNAARTCLHVLYVQYKRTGTLNSQVLAPVQMPLFSACVVLVICMWMEKSEGRDIVPLVEDMRKGEEMLEALEPYEQVASKMRLVLQSLMTAKEPGASNPTPESTPRAANEAATKMTGLGELTIAVQEKLRISSPDGQHDSETSGMQDAVSPTPPRPAEAPFYSTGSGNGKAASEQAQQVDIDVDTFGELPLSPFDNGAPMCPSSGGEIDFTPFFAEFENPYMCDPSGGSGYGEWWTDLDAYFDTSTQPQPWC